jgi:hypothetical protein
VNQDQVKRFEQWRRRINATTEFLVASVVNEIVPLFERRGYSWVSDYAGGNVLAVGPNTIPLQLRQGFEWPTIEITFDKRGRPALGVTFSALPETCWRRTPTNVVEIPRTMASVVEGRAFFHLCKGHQKYNNCNFGYYYFSFSSERRLRRECATLAGLLPWLFELMDDGIPPTWLKQKPGYVHDHAFLNPGSNIFRE